MEHIVTLLMLTMLQVVLGFDNLLYISLESGRAPAAEQSRVRRIGIGLAIGLRILLLIVLLYMVERFKTVLVSWDVEGISHGELTGHALIVFAGGVFIMYTAVKEIFHMMRIEEHEAFQSEPASTKKVIAMITIMNVVFSFDSILSAMALTENRTVMAAAIVIGGVLMIVLSDRVSGFLKRNRMYEVLGLFVLLIVGIMLLSEAGHLAHLSFFGSPIQAMSKGTFYFVIAVLVLVDIVQGRYQKKLLAAADSPH